MHCIDSPAGGFGSHPLATIVALGSRRLCSYRGAIRFQTGGAQLAKEALLDCNLRSTSQPLFATTYEFLAWHLVCVCVCAWLRCSVSYGQTFVRSLGCVRPLAPPAS